MTYDAIDIRKMLRAADALVKAGNPRRAVQVYDRVAEHYASQGRHVHAVAISKQVIAMIDADAPILAPVYRHVWLRLATSYESLRMQSEADDARDRWAALAGDEAQAPTGGRDQSN